MRIVQVTQHYLPVHGGVETVVHETSTRLVRDGYDVTVVCERETGTMKNEVIDGVKVHRVLGFRLFKLKYDVGRIAPEMLLAARKSKADVVHCHNYGHFPLWVSCFTNKPTVVTPHSDPATKIYKFWDAFRSVPLRLADWTVAVTEMEKQNLILRGARKDRVVVIPNGVTLPPCDVPELRLGPSIFCLARLDMWTKGQDVLIRAMPNVINQVKDARLYIAGTGKDLVPLKKIAKDVGVENRVIFLGEVDNYTKALYLKNCSVFCLPSRIEAFGIVYLEAMAFGRPIVAAKVGGVPEVIGESGLVVEKNDPAALSNALIDILSNQALADKLRAKSLERVKIFDWNRIVKRYERLYEKMLH